MERDVELAIHHAVDLVRARGGKLASITLRGTGTSVAVHRAAAEALSRLGMSCPELCFVCDAGPVRLESIELQP